MATRKPPVFPPVTSAPAHAFRPRGPLYDPPKPSTPIRLDNVELDARMLENEERRLERLLAQYTRELDELEKQIDLTTPRNRRYNVNFTIPIDVADDDVFTQSAIVNRGTRFYAMELQAHYTVQSTGATFNLGPVLMRKFFDFEWRVRDTGSDREWSNDWLPSDFLYSGDVCGLLSQEAPALIAGNAGIEVDVRVSYSQTDGEGSLFDDIQQHILQLSFVGVEVPE